MILHASNLWVDNSGGLRRRGRAPAAPMCRAEAARDTAFFPPKTRKFACRFFRNAYYDRMKRVNPRRAVISTGDRPLPGRTVSDGSAQERIRRRLVMVDKPEGLSMERQVLLIFVCPVPAAEQLLEMAL
jgi:hypothetical protein